MNNIIKDLGLLCNLTISQYKVFALLLDTFKDNQIILNRKIKHNILNRVGLVEGSFKNILTVLVRKELLVKGNKKGIYYINTDLGINNTSTRLIVKYDKLGNRQYIRFDNNENLS